MEIPLKSFSPLEAEKGLAGRDARFTPDNKSITPTTPTEVDDAQIDPVNEARMVRKMDFRIVPTLFAVYVMAFLDRINIGNARIQGLTQDLHPTPTGYNVALLIFFVPYILLEVPSNIMLRRVPPSWWIGSLMFFWGLVTIGQGLVTTMGGLIACRFTLGVCEAGIFPGVLYLLSMYYKRHELQQRWSWFYCSGLVAGAFGGLLAFAIAKMDGICGYRGWRWIFIIEGIATCFVAICAKLLIVDWPETTAFLNGSEKGILADRLLADRFNSPANMDRLDKAAWGRILKDWKIWTGTLMYLTIAASTYSTAFFVPTILNEFGYSTVQSQLRTIPIYVVCVVCTLSTAYASDKLKHRYLFTLGGSVTAAIGYSILLGQQHLSREVKYFACFLVLAGIYVTAPIILVWLQNNLSGHYKRSCGAAFQIGVGNLGGIVGSFIYLDWEKPHYWTGYGTALALLVVCELTCTFFHFALKRENRIRDNHGRDERYLLPQSELENMGDDHPAFRFTP